MLPSHVRLNTPSRRAVLALIGGSTLAGTGTAQEGPENSIRIRITDCETVHINGARVLNENGKIYYAYFHARGITPDGRSVARGYHIGRHTEELGTFTFPHTENVLQKFYDFYGSSDFDVAVVVRAQVRRYVEGEQDPVLAIVHPQECLEQLPE